MLSCLHVQLCSTDLDAQATAGALGGQAPVRGREGEGVLCPVRVAEGRGGAQLARVWVEGETLRSGTCGDRDTEEDSQMSTFNHTLTCLLNPSLVLTA